MNDATSPAWYVQLGGKGGRPGSSSAARAPTPPLPIKKYLYGNSCKNCSSALDPTQRMRLTCECKGEDGQYTSGKTYVYEDECKQIKNNKGALECIK